MTSLALRLTDWLMTVEPSTTTAPDRRRAIDPPLIGDIVTARAGVPEHLLQWRKAEGARAPDPQL